MKACPQQSDAQSAGFRSPPKRLDPSQLLGGPEGVALQLLPADGAQKVRLQAHEGEFVDHLSVYLFILCVYFVFFFFFWGGGVFFWGPKNPRVFLGGGGGGVRLPLGKRRVSFP